MGFYLAKSRCDPQDQLEHRTPEAGVTTGKSTSANLPSARGRTTKNGGILPHRPSKNRPAPGTVKKSKVEARSYYQHQAAPRAGAPCCISMHEPRNAHASHAPPHHPRDAHGPPALSASRVSHWAGRATRAVFTQQNHTATNALPTAAGHLSSESDGARACTPPAMRTAQDIFLGNRREKLSQSLY